MQQMPALQSMPAQVSTQNIPALQTQYGDTQSQRLIHRCIWYTIAEGVLMVNNKFIHVSISTPGATQCWLACNQKQLCHKGGLERDNLEDAIFQHALELHLSCYQHSQPTHAL